MGERVLLGIVIFYTLAFMSLALTASAGAVLKMLGLWAS